MKYLSVIILKSFFSERHLPKTIYYFNTAIQQPIHHGSGVKFLYIFCEICIGSGAYFLFKKKVWLKHNQANSLKVVCGSLYTMDSVHPCFWDSMTHKAEVTSGLHRKQLLPLSCWHIQLPASGWYCLLPLFLALFSVCVCLFFFSFLFFSSLSLHIFSL